MAKTGSAHELCAAAVANIRQSLGAFRVCAYGRTPKLMMRILRYFGHCMFPFSRYYGIFVAKTKISLNA